MDSTGSVTPVKGFLDRQIDPLSRSVLASLISLCHWLADDGSSSDGDDISTVVELEWKIFQKSYKQLTQTLQVTWSVVGEFPIQGVPRVVVFDSKGSRIGDLQTREDWRDTDCFTIMERELGLQSDHNEVTNPAKSEWPSTLGCRKRWSSDELSWYHWTLPIVWLPRPVWQTLNHSQCMP